MEALIALVILLAFLVACLVLAWRHPLGVLVGLVVLVLAASCNRADAARRFELSVVADADTAAIDEAVKYAAGIFRDQLDTELVITRRTTSTVAGHTKPEALLSEVVNYRLASTAEQGTDATVLLTGRELTRLVQGIATVGPACSEGAAAVVSIHSDGFDGQILAHELLHTVGIPHDHAAGYLMSETKGRAGSDYVSPDSLATFNAAPLGCLSVAVTPSVQSSAGGVPTGTTGQGGGGAFEWWFLLVICALCFVADRREGKHKARIVELEAEVKALQPTPPADAILSINSVEAHAYDYAGHRLEIGFTTYTAMNDFGQWVTLASQAQRTRAHQ